MVAAAIAALGLSTPAQQAQEGPIHVRITPLSVAIPRSKVALDPARMDATWYSSLLMPSARAARDPHQPPPVSSSGTKATLPRVDPEEGPDKAAAAAARLTKAGRGPKDVSCHKATSAPAPAPEAKPVLPSQDEVAAGRSDVPTLSARHTPAATAAGREAELPEEVATLNFAAGAPAAGLQQDDMPVSAQAATEVALLSAAGGSRAELPRNDLPETASRSPKASSVQKTPTPPSSADMSLTAPAENTHIQRLPWEQPDQATVKITQANRARAAATTLLQHVEGFQQRSEAAAPAERSRSAVLPSPQKSRWEQPDQAPAAATLDGGAMLASCASDAAQQAQRNHALVSELKQHLEISGPRPSAGPNALVRPLTALFTPQGILYTDAETNKALQYSSALKATRVMVKETSGIWTGIACSQVGDVFYAYALWPACCRRGG